jgi:hypothetical protein
MYAAVTLLAASVLCPCKGPNSTLRSNDSVSLGDYEGTVEAQTRVFDLVEAGAWAGALEKVRVAIARDSEVWGLDDRLVVFDHALLALVQKANSEEGEARRTAFRLLSIPPEKPLFRYSDPAEIVELLQGVLEFEHRDRNDDTLYQLLLNLLDPAGSEADGARAALYYWIGVQQKVWGFDAEDDVTGHDYLLKARVSLYKSLAIGERTYGAYCPRLAPCLNQLAIVEALLCNFELTRVLFARAVNLALLGCQSDVLHISDYLENYRWALTEVGLQEEARFVLSWEGQARSWDFQTRRAGQ